MCVCVYAAYMLACMQTYIHTLRYGTPYDQIFNI